MAFQDLVQELQDESNDQRSSEVAERPKHPNECRVKYGGDSENESNVFVPFSSRSKKRNVGSTRRIVSSLCGVSSLFASDPRLLFHEEAKKGLIGYLAHVHCSGCNFCGNVVHDERHDN